MGLVSAVSDKANVSKIVLLTVMARLDESWAGNAPLPESQRRPWCCLLLFAVGEDCIRCEAGRASATEHLIEDQ